MRDILFRGKRVGDGKWVYGNLIQAPGYCCILEREEDLHPMDAPYLDGEIGWVDGKATPVIPETVGQFFELLDKNGQKIFEGDIVKGAVLYDVGCYPHEEIVTRAVSYDKVFPGMFNTIEVIGNIHDNPELLEEK